MTKDQVIAIAKQLRAVRENPPDTIGEAIRSYREALTKARRAGVPDEWVMLVGELLWMSLRPEKEPAPDEIGSILDAAWRHHDANEALPCCDEYGAGARWHAENCPTRAPELPGEEKP